MSEWGNGLTWLLDGEQAATGLVVGNLTTLALVALWVWFQNRRKDNG